MFSYRMPYVWATVIVLILSVSGGLDAGVETFLPVKGEELMPLEFRKGVYRTVIGDGKKDLVPFSLEQKGRQWILTKEGMSQHELSRDRDGNILIDGEINLRDSLEIRYDPPIVLLPAVVERDTLLTGTTRVAVQNVQKQTVRYRGTCDWELTFMGTHMVDMPAGTLPSYHFHAKRKIRFSLANIIMSVDFEYVRGEGMIATEMEQMRRLLGLFSEKEAWRLERVIGNTE